MSRIQILIKSLVIATLVGNVFSQATNFYHLMPKCPGGKMPLMDENETPLGCLPSSKLYKCPSRDSVCWYDGLNFLCCPMDRSPPSFPGYVAPPPQKPLGSHQEEDPQFELDPDTAENDGFEFDNQGREAVSEKFVHRDIVPMGPLHSSTFTEDYDDPTLPEISPISIDSVNEEKIEYPVHQESSVDPFQNRVIFSPSDTVDHRSHIVIPEDTILPTLSYKPASTEFIHESELFPARFKTADGGFDVPESKTDTVSQFAETSAKQVFPESQSFPESSSVEHNQGSIDSGHSIYPSDPNFIVQPADQFGSASFVPPVSDSAFEIIRQPAPGSRSFADAPQHSSEPQIPGSINAQLLTNTDNQAQEPGDRAVVLGNQNPKPFSLESKPRLHFFGAAPSDTDTGKVADEIGFQSPDISLGQVTVPEHQNHFDGTQFASPLDQLPSNLPKDALLAAIELGLQNENQQWSRNEIRTVIVGDPEFQGQQRLSKAEGPFNDGDQVISSNPQQTARSPAEATKHHDDRKTENPGQRVESNSRIENLGAPRKTNSQQIVGKQSRITDVTLQPETTKPTTDSSLSYLFEQLRNRNNGYQELYYYPKGENAEPVRIGGPPQRPQIKTAETRAQPPSLNQVGYNHAYARWQNQYGTRYY